MQDERLKDFILVGGTALALQIGHRISIDIDLFSPAVFDENSLKEYLNRDYQFEEEFRGSHTLKGIIEDIKIDLITHAYPFVQAPSLEQNIRMASLPDIAAMKLNAIHGNGTRIKDFVDIAYLSSQLTLSQMLEAYAVKYAASNITSAVKSLAYFGDINVNEPVRMTNPVFEWKKIETRIVEMIEKPDSLFPSS